MSYLINHLNNLQSHSARQMNSRSFSVRLVRRSVRRLAVPEIAGGILARRRNPGRMFRLLSSCCIVNAQSGSFLLCCFSFLFRLWWASLFPLIRLLC